jgi:hypothetical protein
LRGTSYLMPGVFPVPEAHSNLGGLLGLEKCESMSKRPPNVTSVLQTWSGLHLLFSLQDAQRLNGEVGMELVCYQAPAQGALLLLGEVAARALGAPCKEPPGK